MDRLVQAWLDLMVRSGKMTRAHAYLHVKQEARQAEEGRSPRRGETLWEKKAEIRQLRYS